MAIKIKKKGRRDDEVDPLDQPDQFIQTADKSVGWAAENRQTVIAGGVAVLVALLVLAGGVLYVNSKAASMSDSLTDAVKVMRAPIGDAPNPDAIAAPIAPKDGEDEKAGLRFDSSQKKYDEMAVKAEAVLSSYPTEPAGEFAKLIKARALHGQGKYAKAATLYKAWADAHAGAPEQAFVLQSLATAQAAAGQTDAAIASLEALKALGEDAWGETAGYQIGRIYQEAGQKDKARAAYEGVLTKYPDSSRAELVKMHLDFL